MNLPNSVIIAGRSWPVIMDRSAKGGKWTSNPGEIRVGPHKSEEEMMTWFIHEVLEAILCMRNHRFDTPFADENDMFVFDHRDFTNVVRDFYLAIRSILPTKGNK